MSLRNMTERYNQLLLNLLPEFLTPIQCFCCCCCCCCCFFFFFCLFFFSVNLWICLIAWKEYTSGPRYWNVPVLVNTQGNCATEGNSGNCQSGNCHSGERWMRKPSVHGGKWKSNEGIDNIANGPVNNMSFFMLYKWQMICFQALWKTKSFVKVCSKFKLPLWTKGLLIHLSPLWQLPLWHFPRWHNVPVY